MIKKSENNDEKSHNSKKEERTKTLTTTAKTKTLMTARTRSLAVQETQPDTVENRSNNSEQEKSGGENNNDSKKCENRSPDDDQTQKTSIFQSKRVKYKREIGRNAVVVEDDEMCMDLDKTIRDENRFLKKIEKCKLKQLQRVCVCPLTTCYKLTDALDFCKTWLHRVNRVIFVACCPPCCCIIRRAAFWPPRSEYFFFIPNSVDEEPLDVRTRMDARKMSERKKTLKKYRNARKCAMVESEIPFRIGLTHPCANDVKRATGFVLRTSRKNHIACVYIKCPEQPARFTMLYSHPNGSDISDHLIGVPSLIDIARFYKCDVYSYDYSGYGISDGSPSEKNMYADIQAIFDHITIEKSVNPKNLIMLGYSIGTAAIVECIRRNKERAPAGAILQSAPTSLLRVIEGMLGRKDHLEKASCCIDRFRTIDKIAEVQIPVLCIHGTMDKTVPVAHGQLICERAVLRVPPEWVPNAAHDNIENCREVWIRIRKFVKQEVGLGRRKSIISKETPKNSKSKTVAL